MNPGFIIKSVDKMRFEVSIPKLELELLTERVGGHIEGLNDLDSLPITEGKRLTLHLVHKEINQILPSTPYNTIQATKNRSHTKFTPISNDVLLQ